MNLFNDIENKELQAWNRAAVAFNTLKEHGLDKMKTYLSKISTEERKLVASVFTRIKEEGYEKVRAELNRKMQNGG
jgi:hypothetical protein